MAKQRLALQCPFLPPLQKQHTLAENCLLFFLGEIFFIYFFLTFEFNLWVTFPFHRQLKGSFLPISIILPPLCLYTSGGLTMVGPWGWSLRNTSFLSPGNDVGIQLGLLRGQSGMGIRPKSGKCNVKVFPEGFWDKFLHIWEKVLGEYNFCILWTLSLEDMRL